MTRVAFGIVVTALLVLVLALGGCKGTGGQEGCGCAAGCGGGCGAGCGCQGCGCGDTGCGGCGCGCGCGAGAKMSGTDKSRAQELFRAYKSWRKMNDKAFLSKPHGRMMVYDYVNSRGQRTFTAKRGTYLAGTAICKVGTKGGEVKKIWFMEKKQLGYDREDGNWWYAQLTPSGKVEKAGKVASCIDCHGSADNDYVYGLK